MARLKILVIDDEQLICWSFKKRLTSIGYQVVTAGTGEKGLELFQEQLPDVIFLDNRLPDIEGLQLMERFNTQAEEVYIIFMTAYGTINTAVRAMKMGAFDYLTKPFSFSQIEIILENIEKKIKTEQELFLLKRDRTHLLPSEQFIGKSKSIQEILHFARKIACSNARTILLLGESGTGKDLLAKVIHKAGPRQDKPFVVINCSSLTETLLESELFGHERGAFTDAKKKKKGLFEIADGGTIFLDEIGEVNTTMQVKLLQFLENKTFRRVGGTEDLRVDVNIIAATNKNLEEAVIKKTFREDLYYRLKIFQIHLPPLRERKEDIPVLAKHFIRVFNKEYRKKIVGLTDESITLLQRYYWPGNVRELRNLIERAVILANSIYIDVDTFPSEITLQNRDANHKFRHFARSLVANEVPLAEIEKMLLKEALQQADNNKTRAAKLLHISRDILRYKIKKYNLA